MSVARLPAAKVAVTVRAKNAISKLAFAQVKSTAEEARLNVTSERQLLSAITKLQSEGRGASQ